MSAELVEIGRTQVHAEIDQRNKLQRLSYVLAISGVFTGFVGFSLNGRPEVAVEAITGISCTMASLTIFPIFSVINQSRIRYLERYLRGIQLPLPVLRSLITDSEFKLPHSTHL